MDIEKLKETLAANGIDEETIAKILADLEKEPEEKKEGEESQAEGKPEEDVPPANDDEGEGEEEPEEGSVDDGAKEEGNAPEEGGVPPQVLEEVPPTDVPPTDVPPSEEVPPQPPVEEVPPIPEEVPPTPPFNPEEFLAKIDEQGKTIEGLLARIESLEGALAQAGVLDKSDEESEIGVDDSNVPPTGSNGAIDEFDDALSILNGRKRY